MFTHPDCVRSSFKLEIKDGSPANVLIIETSLELDSTAREFNSSALNDLIDAAVKAMKDHPTVIDRTDIVPAERA